MKGPLYNNNKRTIMARVDALPAHAFGRLRSASGEELSTPFHSGGAPQSALLPSAEGATIEMGD